MKKGVRIVVAWAMFFIICFTDFGKYVKVNATSINEPENLSSTSDTDDTIWTDFLPENGIVDGDYENEEPIRLTEDVVIKGNMTISEPVILNGYSLTVEGDLVIGSTIYIDGTLTVGLGVTWTQGDVIFQHGKLLCEGNFDNYGSTECLLSLNNDDDYLYVGGNFSLFMYSGVHTNITAGVFDLCGDFIQCVNDSSMMNNNYHSFYMCGSSKLLLSGSSRQEIYTCNDNVFFEKIEVNTEGYSVDADGNIMFGERQIVFGSKRNYTEYEDYGCPTLDYISCDNLESYMQSREFISYDSVYFQGESAEFDSGTVIFGGDLIIDGDFNFTGDKLVVLGDLRIQSLDENGNFTKTDASFRVGKDVNIYIYGDLITESTQDHSEYLNGGTWYLYGNVKQIGKDYCNLVFGEDATVNIENLNGSKPKDRHIYIDNPIGNPFYNCKNYLNQDQLVIDNVLLLKEHVLNFRNYKGTIGLSGDYVAYSRYDGNIRIIGPTTIDCASTSMPRFTGDVFVDSDLSFQHNLEVEGDLIVNNGTLNMKTGTLCADNVIFKDESETQLLMTGGRIVCHDFIYGSKLSSGELSDGKIECSGDFVVKNTGAEDSFVSTGNHTVELTGRSHNNKIQKVNIVGKDSCIETLNIRTDFVNITPTTNIKHINNYGARYINIGVEGRTLEDDEVFDGDMVIVDGTLNLNGHKLTVNGDLYAEDGSVDINGGCLDVKGSVNFKTHPSNVSDDRNELSTAELVMENTTDKITIKDDLNICIGDKSFEDAVSGSITVGGDVNIDGVSENAPDDFTKKIFAGVSVTFVGNGEHTINCDSTEAELDIHNLISSGATQISSVIPVYLSGNLDLDGTKGNFTKITIDDISESYASGIVGNITIKSGKLMSDMEVDGVIGIAGEADLNGHNLSAKTLYVNEPLHISEGKLNVSNSIYIYNKLWMISPEDEVHTKNMYVNVLTNDSDYMTNGTIYVTGEYIDDTSDSYAFLPSNEHKVVFDSNKSGVELSINNSNSILNVAEFKCAINNYVKNRNYKTIAKKIIASYDDKEKPTKPTGVKVSDYSYIAVITWDEANDDMGLDHYDVYKNGEIIGSTEDLFYNDFDVMPGDTYYYTIKSVDLVGNTSFGSREYKITIAKDENKPQKLADVTPVVNAGTVSMDLTNIYKDECLDYIIVKRNDVEIERLDAYSACSYYDCKTGKKTVHEFHSGNLVFTDDSLEYGNSYDYVIVAVDRAGNKSIPYTLTVHPDFAPAEAVDFDVASQNGINKIEIKCGTVDSCGQYDIYKNGEKFATIDANFGKDILYTDADVIAGEEYTYSVMGIGYHGSCGIMSETKSVVAVTDDTKPVIKDVECSISGNIINEKASFDFGVSDDGGIARARVYLRQVDSVVDIFDHTEEEFVSKKDYKFDINDNNLSGNYTLCIDVWDRSGNVAEYRAEYCINNDGLRPVSNVKYKAYASYVTMTWDSVAGASYYSIEQKKGSKYNVIYRLSDNSIVIDGLDKETTYTFRIIAYDANNVRGLPMSDINITTAKDVTPPVIESVYEDGKILGKQDSLSIIGSDDIAIDKAHVYYRKNGTGEWTKVEGNGNYINGYSNIKVPWDKSALKSGEYEVMYKLEDTSGNLSESVVRTYYLDAQGVEVKQFELVPEDWQIKLKWDYEEADDFAYYEVEKISSSEYDKLVDAGKNIQDIHGAMIDRGNERNEYEEIVSPKENNVYILRVFDVHKNETTEVVCGASLENDPFAPVVNGLSPVFSSVGSELSLTGCECTDNDEIIDYEWDMGNGDIISGIDCDYIYTSGGSYEVTLTITDKSGNKTTKTTSVMVGEGTGQVNVTVTDGKNPIEGADVVACINDEVYRSCMGDITDGKGKLIFELPKGQFHIAAYKSGYEANEVIVNVIKGHSIDVEIVLKKGDTFSIDSDVHEMTLEEIKEAGLDLGRIGENVFQCDIVLTYEGHEIKKKIITFDNIYGGCETIDFKNTGSVEGTGGSNPKIDIYNASSESKNPVYVVTEVVPVNISWMKKVYEVNVTMVNKGSESFRLKDATAMLDLDENLHIVNDESDQSWNINELCSGESISKQWYITGDKAGTYPLYMDMEAMLYPNEKAIHERLKSNSNIVIEEQRGLHLCVYPESTVYVGENFYVQFKLTNESSSDYYYVKTDFGAFQTENTTYKEVFVTSTEGEESKNEVRTEITISTDVSYFVPEDAKDGARNILQNADTMTVERLKPNDSIYGTYKTTFGGGGASEDYVFNLIEMYVDYKNAENSGVYVSIEPTSGHMSKGIIEVKKPKPRPAPTSNSDKKTSSYTITTKDSTEEHGEETNSNTTNPSTESGGNNVKDPIDITTGAFNVEHSPVVVSGGMNYSFNMSYDSRYTDSVGELGRGWYHNYETKLEHNGALIALHNSPYNVTYFTESEETENIVCGTLDGDKVILAKQDNIERTYYQMGDVCKKNYITKNKDGYTLTMGSETYTFDCSGALTGYTDEDGKQLEISRTSDKLIIADKATGKKI
nr:DUF6531 domain-containing protein [Lachnospiraceae bacterium]